MYTHTYMRIDLCRQKATRPIDEWNNMICVCIYSYACVYVYARISCVYVYKCVHVYIYIHIYLSQEYYRANMYVCVCTYV